MPHPSNLTLRTAKRLISRWSLPQQRRLLAWLRAEVDAADAAIEENWSLLAQRLSSSTRSKLMPTAIAVGQT